MKSHLPALLLIFAMFFLLPRPIGYASAAIDIAGSNANAETTLSAESKAVSVIHFPDRNFEAKVRSIIGKPMGDIWASDVGKITDLEISTLGITDLTGIEYFVSLEALDCAWNNVANIDLSANTELRKLDCVGNELTTLDLSKNAKLVWLNVFDNDLISLDLSHNTELTWLNCGENQLSALDVSKNTLIEELYCSANSLTTLALGENVALIGLECDTNDLEMLNVSQIIGLEWLECSQNKLTKLDISNNTKLAFLGCYNNKFSNKNAIKGLDEEKLTYGFVFTAPEI